MSISTRPKRGVPEGLWISCPKCKATLFRKELEDKLNVCPECSHHFYVSARARIKQLLDEDSFEEWFTDLRPCDPLQFHDRMPYSKRIVDEQKKTGMPDAAVVGRNPGEQDRGVALAQQQAVPAGGPHPQRGTGRRRLGPREHGRSLGAHPRTVTGRPASADDARRPQRRRTAVPEGAAVLRHVLAAHGPRGGP